MGSKKSLLLESVQRLLRRGANRRAKALLARTRPEDIATIFHPLVPRERRLVFDMLEGTQIQALVLAEMDEGLIPHILDPMPLDKVVTILQEVPADDVADILGCLDEQRAAAILAKMKDADSDPVEDLMGYDPETAGGIMSPDFFSLPPESTVGEAISALQKQHEDIEMAFYIYVANEHDHLVGVVSLRQLVMTKPEVPLTEIMDAEVVSVPVDADQEEVAEVVGRYNFLAVPVVDDLNKLVGIVTVDDIIDVLHDEATEDILKLAGAGQELALGAPVREHLRMRYPWLVASCVGGFIAALVLDPFITHLGPFLALFVPIVIGMAGNVGIQSSTIVVRGLATGTIDIGQTAQVIRREVAVGLLLGAGYGAAVGVLAASYSWINGTSPDFTSIIFYGLAVGLALSVAILIAATVGTIMPIALNRMKFDPAVATGPFVTTSLDVLGLLAYFTIAIILARVFHIPPPT